MRLGRRRFGLLGLLAALPLPAAARQGVTTERQLSVLNTIAGDLFPHGTIASEAYRSAAETFFQAQPEVSQQLVAAVGPDDYPETGPAQRRQRLRGVQRQPAFLAFRMHVLMRLYGDLAVTSHFGYEGPSLEQGGYLHRGFDEISWLPGSAEHAHRR